MPISKHFLCFITHGKSSPEIIMVEVVYLFMLYLKSKRQRFVKWRHTKVYRLISELLIFNHEALQFKLCKHATNRQKVRGPQRWSMDVNMYCWCLWDLTNIHSYNTCGLEKFWNHCQWLHYSWVLFICVSVLKKTKKNSKWIKVRHNTWIGHFIYI